MRILLSGSRGLVGSSLGPFLISKGHQVVSLVRKEAGHAVFWDPSSEKWNKSDFEGFDAVIHLAGENLATGRWTKKKKDRIFLSRCRDTWLLSHILSKVSTPPKIFICASAVGFYGNRGTELLTESSSKGSGFLADLCAKWEAASEVLENKGTRVVHTRFGAILSLKGGLLARLLPALRLGLGAKLGQGNQILSWIALEDVLQGISYVLDKTELKGPINFVAPHPVTQDEFMDKTSAAFHKKVFLRIPSFLLRLVFGEMADEVLLTSQNAIPVKLLESGYRFLYPDLDEYLEKSLG